MNQSNTIPDGYRQNAIGHLVPEDTIEEIDIARDDLVVDIAFAAKALRDSMSTFKRGAMDDAQAFIELAAEKYDVQLGGRKGNVTLTSFDGKYRVLIAVADRLRTDEKLQAAKALVDQCAREWSEGARPEVRALVEHAFQTDKEGKINIGRLLDLTRLKIEDATWQKAMQALKDSLTVESTSTYLRIYERRENGEGYDQIALDLAAL